VLCVIQKCEIQRTTQKLCSQSKGEKVTGKKFFTGIQMMILKFGIAVFLSCGLTSCGTLLDVMFDDGTSANTEQQL
jgi:hypothetical protein